MVDYCLSSQSSINRLAMESFSGISGSAFLLNQSPAPNSEYCKRNQHGNQPLNRMDRAKAVTRNSVDF